MRKVLICAAIAAAVATPSLAAPSVLDAAKDASTMETAGKARMLYICDTSDATKRSFVREHGAMEFVTAEAATQDQGAWSAPRCITRTEYRRLQQMVSQNSH